jgi:hypothetical protein
VQLLVRLAAPFLATLGLAPLPERKGVDCWALSATAAKGTKPSKSGSKPKRPVRAVRSHTIERLQLAFKDAATRSIEVPVVRKKIHRCLEVKSP